MISVVAGLALGAAAAAAASRLLTTSPLYEVAPTDALTFVIVLFGLLTVALIAVLIRARRAARVQPTETLRM